MTRVTIEIQYEDGRREVRQFSEGTYMIGRDAGDIVLRHSQVSARHGELKIADRSVTFVDQGSTNGSFTADGERIKGPVQMSVGTSVQMGECRITAKAIDNPLMATVLSTAAGGKAPQPKPVAMAVPIPMAAIKSPPRAVVAPAASQPAAKQPVVAPKAAPARVEVPPTIQQPTVSPIGTAPTLEQPALDPEQWRPSARSASSQGEKVSGSSAGDSHGAAPAAGSLDIMEMLKAPMADKNWITKCLVVGLIALIPVAGWLNLGGYLIACCEARVKRAAELPEANLNYIGRGWGLFLAYLPVIGILLASTIVFSWIFARVALGLFMFGNLVSFAISVFLLAAAPAINYLHIIRREQFASIKFKEMLELIKSDFNSYLMLWLVCLIAGIIGGLGQIVLVVGVLFTMPYSIMVQGIAIAEYHAMRGSSQPGAQGPV